MEVARNREMGQMVGGGWLQGLGALTELPEQERERRNADCAQPVLQPVAASRSILLSSSDRSCLSRHPDQQDHQEGRNKKRGKGGKHTTLTSANA